MPTSKGSAASSLPLGLGDLWTLARKVERLLQLEEAQNKVLGDLKDQLVSLDKRLSHLESRQDVTVNEAKAAARAASYEATQGVVSDLARRIGTLEASAAARTKRIRSE